ncbi:beta-2 adrenergic receptor-like [Asterias amurensis]|uniref:beta-2 adrenergic receptor-like n=1 Tax=Asterias amurensis TaxID=7602 RepID=UPI003AB4820A
MCNSTIAAVGCAYILGKNVSDEEGFDEPDSSVESSSSFLTTSDPEVFNPINFLLWLLWTLIVGGNILVMSVIIRDRELLLKPANIFILNLAASDLLVGIISMTFQNIWQLKEDWIFGELMCKCWTIVDFSAATQSAFAIVLISFDRLMLVSTGLKYKQYITIPKTCILVIVTWVISLLINAIPILLSDKLFGRWVEYSNECDFGVSYQLGYQWPMFVLSFIVPIVLVAFFNITVYNNIRQRARRFQGRSTSDFKKHRKAAVTLALIVGVFLICWVPYWINKFAQIINIDNLDNKVLSDALAYLLWSNSAINPFLYAVTNPRIRSGMLHILRKPLPKRWTANNRRQRGTLDYNLGETNMTKITRQDGD